MIDATLIGRIEELVEARHHELETDDGVTLSTRKYHDTRLREPEPPALHIHTLGGVVDYLEADPDGLIAAGEGNVALHVATPQLVKLVSEMRGPFRQRLTYLEALHEPATFAFGTWYGHEEFVIRLGSMFVDAGDRAAVVKLAGTVTAEQGVKTEDDGITQTVHVKQGITFIGTESIPNPVELAPFRTFNELEQPAGKYLLRARGGQSAPVEWALFEADGGAWELTAIERIAAWLAENLGELAGKVPIIQ